jgi:sugar lactone lactonase YvrE
MKLFGFNISTALLVLAILLVLYLLFWPVKINPAAWKPEKLPEAAGVFQPNDLLHGIERLAEGFYGPESVAIAPNGSIYSGLADGRIIKINREGDTVEVFARTAEPLGMKCDRAGNLVIADATAGLISISPAGEVTLLTNEAGGSRILFADDLVIGSDGKIYFSEASTKFTNPETSADIFEHRPNGRVLVYDPDTQETKVLLDQRYFPNGMALGPGDRTLLFTETSKYRVSRLWLSGEKAGTVDVFIDNLPGFPDNITFNGSDTFWLALVNGPKDRKSLDFLLPRPFLRKVLWRLPFLVNLPKRGSGYFLGLDLDGKVIHNLQDPNGEVYPNTTSVIEADGVLYIGSYDGNGIARIAVP